MSAKKACLSGLAVALLGLGVARAGGNDPPDAGCPICPGPAAFAPSPGTTPGRLSEPSANEDANGNGDAGRGHGAAPGGGGPPPGPLGWSSWLRYPRSPGCCGPVGGDGPIGSEVYLRTGASFALGDGVLADAADVGWAIRGGGRSLFFNPARDAAWTADL